MTRRWLEDKVRGMGEEESCDILGFYPDRL